MGEKVKKIDQVHLLIGVGSQGDGACQFLCKSAEAQKNLVHLIEIDFPDMTAYSLTIPTGI